MGLIIWTVIAALTAWAVAAGIGPLLFIGAARIAQRIEEDDTNG